MLLTVSIVFLVLFASMLVVTRGIEKKEKRSAECALEEFCEIEKLNKCKTTGPISFNYLTMTEN